MSFGGSCRSWFALAPGLRMLNHGSFGACPREVLLAQQRERAVLEADPVAWMEAVPTRLRAVADRVASHLGARGRDLALVENATTGVNTVLRSLDLRPGDRLVTTTHAYGAVRNALRYVACRARASVVEVPVPFPVASSEQVVEAVARHLPAARLLVVDWITSPTGLVLPIGELVSAARSVGVPVLVDAAHAPGQVPVDLDALGADWVTGNLHKWLFAPKGSAFLWAREGRRDDLVPLSVSHDLDLGFPGAFDWTGTRDFTAWTAVPAALRFVDALGGEAIRAYDDALCRQAADMLAERWRVALPSPVSMRAAMAAVPAPGRLSAGRADALHKALQARRIEVPCIPFGGRTWVRISAQIYNTPDEYDALADAVLDFGG